MKKYSIGFSLLLALSMTFSPEALAAQCSDIFPEGQPNNVNAGLEATGDTLDLTGELSGAGPWPGNGGTTLAGGKYVYNGDALSNYSLELAPGAEVTIFVDGDLTLGSGVKFNQNGNANQLLIIVDGDFTTTSNSNNNNNRVDVNGFIYAAETITIANNNRIRGALSAGGTIDIGNANNFSSPAEWLDLQRLAGLCELPGDTVLPVFDNFESYPPGTSIAGNNGGSGWGGPWEGVAGQSIVDTSDDPLEFIDSERRRIRSATTLEIVGNNNEVVARPLDGTFTGDTIFLSMLVRFTGVPSNNDFVAFWIERPNFGDSPQFGLKVNEGGSGTDDFFVRLDQNASYATELTVGQTYLLVAEYSKATNSYFSRAKLWVDPECNVQPPSTPSAERTIPPSSRLSDVSTIGFRSANLSGADAFEVGQIAVGENWTDVVRCSPGPLVEYRMEQTGLNGTAGEIRDTSGNGFNATSFGGMGTQIDDPAIPGNPGTCRYGEFDGNNGNSGDRITDADAGDYLNGLEALTVMAWVYNSAGLNGNDRGIFFTDDSNSGRDNRLGLRYDTRGFFGGASNVIKASVFTDECNRNQECLQVETVGGQMVQNQWQHIAMTWTTDGEIKVFVDGAEVGTSGTQGTGGTGALAGVDRLDIGQGAKGNGQRWRGNIDEFKIFGVALTEAEIRAERNRALPCGGLGPNYIRLNHTGQGLTCSPSRVTVEACANDDCSALFADPVEVSLTSPDGNWSPNPVTVNGQADVELSVRQESTVTLNAIAPSAQNPTRCFSGGVETCELRFFDSGLAFDVPDLISHRPIQNVQVRAVKRDPPTSACVPAFENVERRVRFWSTYVDPDANGRPVSRQVSVDGTDVSRSSGSATELDLTFGTGGIAEIAVRYPDAGRMQLDAEYRGSPANRDDGLIMPGADQFVSRPAGLCVATAGACAAADASCPRFARAGEAFDLSVTAVGWESDTDADLCAGNPVTPNFAMANIPLTGSVVEPSAGVDGTVTPGSYSHGRSASATETVSTTLSEVGVFEFTATPQTNSYFGLTVPAATSLPAGRFYPDRFVVAVDPGELEAECTAGSAFSYTGQPIQWRLTPSLQIEPVAAGATGNRTLNYTQPGFQRLTAGDIVKIEPDADTTAVDTSGDPLSVTVANTTGALSVIDPGLLSYVYPSGDTVTYDKTVATQVGPFTPDLRFTVDSVIDGDNVSGAGAPYTFTPTASFDLRYGRLEMDNVYGPENLEPGLFLEMPFRLEYWNGSRFVVNLDDSGGTPCTTWDTANIANPEQYHLLQTANGDFTDGEGVALQLDPNGTSGTDELVWNVSTWLWDDSDGDGVLQAPSATATFGVYRGNDRVIYWQER